MHPHALTGKGMDGSASIDQAQAAGTANYVKIAQAALRGRYLLIGVLTVVSAGLAAYVGWHKAKRLYTSEGLVQIHYTAPSARGAISPTLANATAPMIGCQNSPTGSRRKPDSTAKSPRVTTTARSPQARPRSA